MKEPNLEFGSQTGRQAELERKTDWTRVSAWFLGLSVAAVVLGAVIGIVT